MYDCLIVGGGIAGLQAAIQLGRYEHQVVVIDANDGRSTICRSYHNILGWPDGVSGPQLRELGQKQAEALGIHFVTDKIVQASKNGEFFSLRGEASHIYQGRRLLLATGVMDSFPDVPGLRSCLGLTVYVCPDCDGYELKGKRTVVLGSGDVGAKMAVTLTYWSRDIIFINHNQKDISEELEEKLKQNNIKVVQQAILKILLEEDGKISGVECQNGERIECSRGFIAFGGNKVHSELAAQLGIERLENKHIVADPRSKMTSLKNVWTAGDVGVHAEQVTIAMGEGSQAAIWIHKSIMSEKKQEETSR